MRFVAVYWPVGDAFGATVGMRFRDALPAGWRAVIDAPGVFAAVGRAPVRGGVAAVLGGGRGLIIGQLFDRAATDAGGFAMANPRSWHGDGALEIGHRLLGAAWGAYAVIVPDRADPATIEIVRDPLGAQDCVTWQVANVRVVSSGAAYASDVLPPSPGINWDVVAGQLAAPVQVSETLALTAVTAVEPGSLCRVADGRIVQRPIWRPADHCWPSHPPRLPTPDTLECMVDACVAAWAACYSSPVAELSGGLDSAIVAASLRRCGATVSHWFTYFGDAPEADERAFARATAARLNLPLVETARSPRGLVEADFALLSAGFRPGMTGMDIHHDRDMAERAHTAGADAIFTGQGGDAVFFQMPTAAVAADTLAGGCTPAKFARATIRAAHWTRSTVWSVAAQALAGRALPPVRPPSFVRAPPSRAHRWRNDCAEALPAKQLQVFGLANSRVYFVESARAERCDMVHPLLSQPLVELLLATPIGHLTGGDRDRRLAREAFRRRLPAGVIDRHGKGDLTSYYGRLVARSVPMLRGHLCDGRLAAAGLIDHDRLAALLDPEVLAVDDAYTEILSAAILESWLRHWQGG